MIKTCTGKVKLFGLIVIFVLQVVVAFLYKYTNDVPDFLRKDKFFDSWVDYCFLKPASDHQKDLARAMRQSVIIEGDESGAGAIALPIITISAMSFWIQKCRIVLGFWAFCIGTVLGLLGWFLGAFIYRKSHPVALERHIPDDYKSYDEYAVSKWNQAQYEWLISESQNIFTRLSTRFVLVAYGVLMAVFTIVIQ